MRRSLVFCVLVVLSTARAHISAQDQSNQASFRSDSSELVVLPVTVTDKGGRFIPELTRDRFLIFDNGRRQDLALFSIEDAPVSVALVVDNSGSMRNRLGEVIAAAVSFVRLSNPDDEVLAIEFNDSVRDALGGRRLSAGDGPQLEAALRTLVPDGRTALYDALIDGLDHLEQSHLPRKVMVLVSDGGDNASNATLDQVLARARDSNVTIYTIGLFEPGDPDTNEGVLKKLSAATGGRRFLPKSPGPLLQACRQIAREIRSGYTLSFQPPERDGTYHGLRVQVSGPDGRSMIVRTRPGYLADAAQTP